MTTLIERVLELAQKEKAGRVTAIRVKCGELSGVVPDALRFCFDVCVEGTIAAGATLQIDEEPAQWTCEACGHVGRPVSDPHPPHCASCGGTALRLSAGRHFQLVSLEIE
ncbi:hydrogenase maturation nickel metallochaperone HypA [bacterium]|nr:hydrogenase maturation nickel metallochaperone HypA [bacterium]